MAVAEAVAAVAEVGPEEAVARGQVAAGRDQAEVEACHGRRAAVAFRDRPAEEASHDRPAAGFPRAGLDRAAESRAAVGHHHSVRLASAIVRHNYQQVRRSAAVTGNPARGTGPTAGGRRWWG